MFLNLVMKQLNHHVSGSPLYRLDELEFNGDIDTKQVSIDKRSRL